jgi:hypothetical protein
MVSDYLKDAQEPAAPDGLPSKQSPDGAAEGELSLLRAQGSGQGRFPATLRPKAAATVLALGAFIILATVHRHQPVGAWLFWTYLQIWILVGLFLAACAGVGFRLLALFRAAGLPSGERTLLALGLGLLAFTLGLEGFGLCGLLGPIFFFTWPLALVAVGWAPLRRALRGHGRILRRALHGAITPGPLRTATLFFGVAGLALVYLAVMTPENISYDGRWYHMGLAEEYMVRGGIERSPERSFAAALPQLATYLYTWASLLPGASTFVRIELGAHLEFAIFLWTLAGIPLLLRRALPGARIAHAWAAVFLFPGILLYDSSLCGGADHVVAFWAIPLTLAVWRARRNLAPLACLLAITFALGALLTKYQGIYLVVPAAVAVMATAVRLSLAAGRVRGFAAALWVWRGPMLAALWGLALGATHLVKNWVWYGDPIYPLLGRILGGQPWNPSGDLSEPRWITQGPLLHRLWEALLAVFSFAFVPHDWPRFHGDWPVFGFLFSVMLVALPTLRAPRRVLELFAVSAGGVFLWFLSYHQDRYLQILLPLMVVATVAALALAWRMGNAVRAAVVGLVVLQVVWGIGICTFPGHTMAGRSPLHATIDLVAAAARGEDGGRMASYRGIDRVGEILPPDARVLVHEFGPRLGLARSVLTDALPRQTVIDYAKLPSAAEAWRLLHSLGATHVLWQTGVSDGGDSYAADLRFFDLAVRCGVGARGVGPFTVARLPDMAPPAGQVPEMVAYFPCTRQHQPGLYRFGDLDIPGLSGELRPRAPLRSTAEPDVEAIIEKARYVVRDTRCPAPPMPASQAPRFVQAAGRHGVELYVPSPKQEPSKGALRVE